jgi:D-serine/D-alanine/glycine transporter
MPGGLVMPWVVFAFFAFLLWAFTGDPDTLAGLIATPVWFVLLGIGYVFLRRSPFHHAARAEHRAKVASESEEAAAWRAQHAS